MEFRICTPELAARSLIGALGIILAMRSCFSIAEEVFSANDDVLHVIELLQKNREDEV